MSATLLTASLMKLLSLRNASPFIAPILTLVLTLTGSAALFSPIAQAAGVVNQSSGPADNGFTILNKAANVTHWGVAAGVSGSKSPYKGDGVDVSPISLLFFDNKWVYVAGTSADIKIGHWSGVSVALRVDYALSDGYRGKDAAILHGMQTRKSALWFGPAVSWETDLGVASASFLTAGNKGQQANLHFAKTFEMGRFSLSPYIGADWMSSRYVNYYAGVTPSEARIGRPAYQGKSAYRFSFGTRVEYRLTQQQALGLQVGLSHVTSGITDSPIVGTKTSPEIGLIYIYQFK